MKKVRIHFEDHFQDLLHLDAETVEVGGRKYGKVTEGSKISFAAKIFTGRVFDMREVKVGECLTLFQVGRSSGRTILYPIVKIEDIE